MSVQDTDTDEYLAVRFPHISKTWLDDVNAMIGFIKQRCGGNAYMHVPWSGGEPREIEWEMKSLSKKRPASANKPK